jgi:hypothetical protein
MKPELILSFALMVALTALDAKAANARQTYSPAQYLKNFALSACLAEGYQTPEVRKDASASAGGYLELGGLPVEAYEEAAELGKAFLAKKYESRSGSALVAMKCIDFYHSAALDRIAGKYRGK